MTTLEIAEKLREQIKAEWPYVSTILALYANNTNGQFTERIQDMLDRLLPNEVYYVFDGITIELIGPFDSDIGIEVIESLPINQVLFSSEDNPLGILK
jgi:hypothetical protein